MRDLDALLDRDFEREASSAVPSLCVPPTLAGTVPHSLADRDGNPSAPICRDDTLCKPSEPARAAEPFGVVAALCFRCGAPSVGVWHCPTGRDEPACAEHADRFCEGCTEPIATHPYRVEFHSGEIVVPVRYCDDCAELARMDWNGETAAIAPACCGANCPRCPFDGAST